ncbi:hypothetical protein [Streptomyces adelaidensis]|uniref:hypothetical protein n=1 Tax=Streptomyces adelaidensis TaxID=2796465 RepID=UPI00190788D9|nr:hypothetical protein [Streptomyces adelaidensis]
MNPSPLEAIVRTESEIDVLMLGGAGRASVSTPTPAPSPRTRADVIGRDELLARVAEPASGS